MTGQQATTIESATDWTFHARQITKVFGDLRANDGITLQVRPGEVYGLLGPNGAGKTTLVKQIIGLLKPTSGEMTWAPTTSSKIPTPPGNCAPICPRRRCRSILSRPGT